MNAGPHPFKTALLLVIAALVSSPQGALAQHYDDIEAEAEGIEDVHDADPVDEAEVTPREQTLAATPPPSSRSGYTLGFRAGGGYNTLSTPSDPAGAPTLIDGSTFTGPGLQVGAQAGLLITRPTPRVNVGIDAGILYGFMRGVGYAENADRTQRQTVTLTAHTLRMPLLLAVRTQGDGPIGLRMGVGPEFLIGMASAATVSFEQIDAPAPALFTTPTRHVGLLGLLGLHYHAERFDIPLELRFTWDPQVGTSTVERFDDYQSPDSPGKYQVAFNLHIHLTTGVEWRF